MKVIGRTEEQRIFKALLDSDSAEFLAVYGRRRVGKTYLIRTYFEKQIIFDCSGLHQQDTKGQLENFYDTLYQYFPGKGKKTLPSNWLQAFNLLKECITALKSKQKKVIFLDELPWFETHKSGFKSALDNFWNNWCTKRNDIVLIICGSAASWMIKNIINDRGGFHNRVTQKVNLQPFSLAETKAYLLNRNIVLSNYDIAQLYMALGGVPYYLKAVPRGKSVAQIIDWLFFKPNAPLKNEFENLYGALFKNSSIHTSIVQALSSKAMGMTREDLIQHTQLNSGGGLSEALNELIQSGFCTELHHFSNVRTNTLYRLTDEYTAFYFRFIHRSKKASSWMQKAGQQSFKSWSGYAYENIGLRHIEQIKKAIGIHGIYTEESSWIHKGSKAESGAQIDLIIDRSDGCIDLCEVKFYSTVYTITKKYAEDIRRKIEVFQRTTKTRKNIFTLLISTYGTQTNEYKLDSITHEVLLADLFKE